jgi:hypothetical protein
MPVDIATEPVSAYEEEWTLENQGPVLPIGIEVDGALSRDIEVRPWRLKEERELGELRDKNKKVSGFKYATMLLGTICSKLGPHDFSEPSTKLTKKSLVISQMFLGDVIYAYLWCRRNTIGPTLEMRLQCPACEEKYSFNANMDSIPITKASSVEDTMWEYKLKTPFKIRGKMAETLTFGPAKWSVFEGVTGVGSLKASTIVGSLYKIDGVPSMVAKNELDEMMKADLELIIRKIDDHHVGPDMSLEMTCPHCDHEYKSTIDWSGEDFFGASGTE